MNEEINNIINELQSKGRYNRVDRTIKDIKKLGGNLYKKITEKFGGFINKMDIAYYGLEHNPKNPREKLPNITYLWNLPFRSGGYMYGSTLGHTHDYNEEGIQEIYEFHGFGGMLISSENKTRLYLCKKGSKVAVPYNCMMTILNLSEEHLITLDMANPNKNKSSKNILKQHKGPMIALYNWGTLNYALPVDLFAKIELNSNYREFIKDNQPLELKIKSTEPAGLFYSLIEDREELQRRGIELVQAESEITVSGKNNEQYVLDSPLVDLVNREDKLVHKLLDIV